jgi:transcription factor SPN1
MVSDFDLMLQRKKEEQGKRRRKRKNVDIINDSDDLIMELIQSMKEAAEEDRELNQRKQPAIKKLKLLPKVNAQLKKLVGLFGKKKYVYFALYINRSDLHSAFLDCGILNAVTVWVSIFCLFMC